MKELRREGDSFYFFKTLAPGGGTPGDFTSLPLSAPRRLLARSTPLRLPQLEGILWEPRRPDFDQFCSIDPSPGAAAREGTGASTTSMRRLGTLRGGSHPPAIPCLLSPNPPRYASEVLLDPGGRGWEEILDG